MVGHSVEQDLAVHVGEQCESDRGPVLGDRRETDFTLVDAVLHYGGIVEDKQLMREACWGAEVWRLSEVTTEDGELRFGLRPGQELYKAAGQVLKSKRRCIRWLLVLEQILSRARGEGSEQLGRWHCQEGGEHRCSGGVVGGN